MKIAIMNNEERVRQIRLTSVSKRAKGKVQPGKLISLTPGVTLVDVDDWAEAKLNPNLAILLTSKIQPSPAPEANPERVGKFILVEGPKMEDRFPLKKLGEDEACRLVAETLNVDLLTSWRDEEGRSAVRQAIDSQIDTLGPTAKPREKRAAEPKLRRGREATGA